MKIKSVHATWVHVPIPEAQQHLSDFGRISSFDATIVRIETACGLVGYGEAKEEVGSSGNNHGLTALINHKFAPILIGEDPRDINRLWETLYNDKKHYSQYTFIEMGVEPDDRFERQTQREAEERGWAFSKE